MSRSTPACLVPELQVSQRGCSVGAPRRSRCAGVRCGLSVVGLVANDVISTSATQRVHQWHVMTQVKFTGASGAVMIALAPTSRLRHAWREGKAKLRGRSLVAGQGSEAAPKEDPVEEGSFLEPALAMPPIVDPAKLSSEVSAALDRAMDSEESRSMLRELAEAEEGVLRKREELRRIEEQERELQALRRELEMQSQADLRLTEAEEEVSRLLNTVVSAEEEVRRAGAALVEARAGGSVFAQGSGQAQWEERLESAKAAAAAAGGGVLAFLPFALAREPAASVFGLCNVALSCAVLGVTYRYAVRRDVGNVQLQSGVVAAFCLVQALARLDGALSTFSGSPVSLDVLAPDLVEAGQQALAHALAGLGLEICLRQGLVQRFQKEP